MTNMPEETPKRAAGLKDELPEHWITEDGKPAWRSAGLS